MTTDSTESRGKGEMSKKRFTTKDEARAYLNDRYTEQAFRWPLLRQKVSRDLYVRRNLRAAMALTKP